MKTGFLVTAMATALLAAATAGNAPAADRGAIGADPEGAMNGTWMDQGAIDAGGLPSASGGAPAERRIVSADTAIPTVEVGGVRYRLGIDDAT